MITFCATYDTVAFLFDFSLSNNIYFILSNK